MYMFCTIKSHKCNIYSINFINIGFGSLYKNSLNIYHYQKKNLDKLLQVLQTIGLKETLKDLSYYCLDSKQTFSQVYIILIIDSLVLHMLSSIQTQVTHSFIFSLNTKKINQSNKELSHHKSWIDSSNFVKNIMIVANPWINS